ncbi:TonB-dependent receptor plug domain-containing protein [Aureitalea marina]|uniref:TonB-dependent receptor n=1 Tax=Aureitalea marina TaxID=930804 RepID=A0A2S7KRQ7_9FLAO|nr:TonB-dependent receptor [Aureitalea marina]PQB05300.1 TonB-dependent receptor [Aureitalea marina]
MLRTLLFLFLIGFSHLLTAQQIQVFSQSDDQVVSGVALYSLDRLKIATTNLKGQTDLQEFDTEEPILFTHIAHQDTTLTKKEILANGSVVYLKEDESALDEIVLSVSKFGQQKRDIPQQIISLTSEEILFRNPQTAADLLQNSGQVFVQKSQLGGGSPMIRGFSTSRLLTVVDGVRFNTAIFRGGNIQNVISIDPLSIDRTEVILGPGSVVYGSDAIGGVISFYTKKPAFSFEEGMSFSGEALARYSTANQEKTGHLELNFGMKEWAFLTSISYSDFDDLKMGSHGPDDYLRPEYVQTVNGEDVIVKNDDPEKQVSTGYDQFGLMQKIRYMPSKSWDFDLALTYSATSDYDRYDRLIQEAEGNLRYAEWYYGPQRWFSGRFSANHHLDDALLFDDSQLTLAYQQFEESRNNRRFNEVELYQNDEQVDAFSVNLDLTKKIDRTNIFYGLEYVYNLVGSSGWVTDISTGQTTADATRYPDGSSWQSIAAYASMQSDLGPEVSFQGGLRYNHILIDASFEENNAFFDFPFSNVDINTGALTGSAGITWVPNEKIQWKLNFGTAFRAPNIDDVGKVFDSEPGSVVVPNPDLQPEYAYNGEIGVLFNFGNIVRLDLGTYYTILDDALVRRDFTINGQSEIIYQGELSNVQAIQNAGRAEVYGFEAGVEVNFSPQWQLTSQYNITDGFTEEADGSEVPVRHAAPPFGNTHLKYKRSKWSLDAFAEYNGQFNFEDLAPSQQNNPFLYAKDENGNPFSPSWYTLNFGAQYAITKDLQLTALLENITDQRYRPYASGIAAPGTNLILSANYVF